MTVVLNVSDSLRPFTAALFPRPPPPGLSLVTIFTFLQSVGVAHQVLWLPQSSVCLIANPLTLVIASG